MFNYKVSQLGEAKKLPPSCSVDVFFWCVSVRHPASVPPPCSCMIFKFQDFQLIMCFKASKQLCRNQWVTSRQTSCRPQRLCRPLRFEHLLGASLWRWAWRTGRRPCGGWNSTKWLHMTFSLETFQNFPSLFTEPYHYSKVSQPADCSFTFYGQTYEWSQFSYQTLGASKPKC